MWKSKPRGAERKVFEESWFGAMLCTTPTNLATAWLKVFPGLKWVRFCSLWTTHEAGRLSSKSEKVSENTLKDVQS